MAQLSKTLATALKTVSPESTSKMRKACKEEANRFRDTAKLLDEAEKAYEANDFATGLMLLDHARDCIDRKD